MTDFRPPTGMTGKHPAYYLLPVMLYGLLIFVQSSFPSPGGVPDMGPVDKLIHILMYMVLGALILRAFLGLGKPGNKNVLLWSILLSALYGVSDEIHQSFVSVRSADAMDALADLTGSVIGVFFYQIFVAGFPKVARQLSGLTKIGGFITQDRIETILGKPRLSRLRELMKTM